MAGSGKANEKVHRQVRLIYLAQSGLPVLVPERNEANGTGVKQ